MLYYSKILLTLPRYKKIYPNRSNPRNLQVYKHFAKAVGRGTKGRIDKKMGRMTIDSLQIKMRQFKAAWERRFNATIAKDTHDSVVAVSVSGYL